MSESHSEGPETRSDALQGAARCRGCPSLFTPKRPWQAFCNKLCKASFHRNKPEVRMADLERQVKGMRAELEELKRKVGARDAPPERTT